MSLFIDCVQTGASQYHHEDNAARDWTMKSWRCELTALSQLYNLYFIACNDRILVYQPEFPDQSLSPKPPLIICPPVSYESSRPGIDDEDSHSFTHLLVDYLGNDEVLLATCDDGDVICYRTAGIHRAVNEFLQLRSGNKEGCFKAYVTPILHRNVGASAWGLAIHREARIIAISSNAYEVTILAFALASRVGESAEWNEAESLSATDEPDASDFPSPRKYNNFFRLGAAHNLPSISFNNNAYDPFGRWLFGTCITGEVWLWDLHSYPRMSCRTFQMGFCPSARHAELAPQLTVRGCGCLDWTRHPHASWGAMFLDPRSANEVSSLSERSESSRSPPFYHEVGEQKNRFQLSSTTELHAHSHPMLDSTSSSFAISDTASEEAIGDGNTSTGHISTGSTPAMSHAEEAGEENGEREEYREYNMSGYNGPPLPPMQLDPSDLSPVESMVSMPNSFTDSDSDSGLEEVLQDAGAHAYCEIRTEDEFLHDDTRQPSLIITKDDIFLIQRPFQSWQSRTNNSDRIFTMRRPLHPGPFTRNLAPHDRQCFSTQIPELGIFIVGSAIGRVAIFALTRSRNSGEFGFQLEYILPFDGGDQNAIPPLERWSEKWLVGCAVGPLQGELGRVQESGNRRWRLLLYFTDHSMISYELSRKRGDADVGVGGLVV